MPWKHSLEAAAQSVSAPGEDFHCLATTGVEDDLGRNAGPCGKKDDSSRNTDCNQAGSMSVDLGKPTQRKELVVNEADITHYLDYRINFQGCHIHQMSVDTFLSSSVQRRCLELTLLVTSNLYIRYSHIARVC